MQNVFMTGITGKSGWYLLKEIATANSSDYSFTFLVRTQEKGEKVKSAYPLANYCVGDCSDSDFLKREFTKRKYATIIHIAGIQKSIPLVKAAVVWGG